VKKAFGGVLINDQGKILLRRVANDFAGYRWSFAKGTPDPAESPEETALREVREETGYRAEIISQLPGTFIGGLTQNVIYLMRPLGEPEPFCWETSEIRWVDPEDAPALIAQTTNVSGRERDLAILAAAIEVMRTRNPQRGIEIYVRQNSYGAMLNIHLDASTKQRLIAALQEGRFSSADIPINLELSVLSHWVTDTEYGNVRIPLTAINVIE
jgi:8-oxo-dGTP pyrophosphatase MutT (NUDIX family)